MNTETRADSAQHDSMNDVEMNFARGRGRARAQRSIRRRWVHGSQPAKSHMHAYFNPFPTLLGSDPSRVLNASGNDL